MVEVTARNVKLYVTEYLAEGSVITVRCSIACTRISTVGLVVIVRTTTSSEHTILEVEVTSVDGERCNRVVSTGLTIDVTASVVRIRSVAILQPNSRRIS